MTEECLEERESNDGLLVFDIRKYCGSFQIGEMFSTDESDEIISS